MFPLSRLSYVASLLLLNWMLFACAGGGSSGDGDGPSEEDIQKELAKIENAVSEFMLDWGIPGASVGVTKDGKLVYQTAIGYANKETSEPVTIASQFRLASMSKTITAVAIMKLREAGLVDLDDMVFGVDGILDDAIYLNINDARVTDITVRQLLQHTAGWGDLPNRGDPVFYNQYIADQMGEIRPVDATVTIRFMLETQNLASDPGAHYHYSNFGYMVLGRVIEKVAGMNYEQYVETNILQAAGVTNMHQARNLFADKYANEVKYYDYPGAPLVISVYSGGGLVPMPYGGFHIEAMDSMGGWIASATDLLRLLVAVDGFDSKPDILASASVDLMQTRSGVDDSTYGLGWHVSEGKSGWGHTGHFPGNAGWFRFTADGFGWVVLFNHRPVESGQMEDSEFFAKLNETFAPTIKGVRYWPDHDLF